MSDNTINFYDVETSSLEDDAEIIQLSALAVVDNKPVQTFEAKLLFDVSKANPDSLAVNGYTPEKWKDAVAPAVAAKRFYNFLEQYKTQKKISKDGKEYWSAVLAGYNSAGFDQAKIIKLFKKTKTYINFDFQSRDVLQLLLWYIELGGKYEPTNHKLATACEYFGIEIDGPLHDSSVDTRLTFKLALRVSQLLKAGI